MQNEGRAPGYSGLGLRIKHMGHRRGRGWRRMGLQDFAGCWAPPQAPRRPWRSLHPAPGVCPAGRWQATGSRARRGRVLSPRGRGRRLQRSLGRLDSARPAALPGPSALAHSGQSLAQLRGALRRAPLRGQRTQHRVPRLYRPGGGRAGRLGRVSSRVCVGRRKQRVINHPIDLSSSNRQFWLGTCVQNGCRTTGVMASHRSSLCGDGSFGRIRGGVPGSRPGVRGRPSFVGTVVAVVSKEGRAAHRVNHLHPRPHSPLLKRVGLRSIALSHPSRDRLWQLRTHTAPFPARLADPTGLC